MALRGHGAFQKARGKTEGRGGRAEDNAEYRDRTEIGRMAEQVDQIRSSLLPSCRTSPREKRDVKEDHDGRRGRGMASWMSDFQIGKLEDQERMRWFQVKSPLEWKKERRGGGIMASRRWRVGSTPMSTEEPEKRVHLRCLRKKEWSFLKLCQMGEPLLIPRVDLLNQYTRPLPFRYFLFIRELQGPRPKMPLWKDTV